MFVDKAVQLQAAGAVGMVVVNSDSSELMAMGTDAQGTQTAIPAVLLTGADGGVLLNALLSGGAGGSSGGSSEKSSSSDGSSGNTGSRVRLRLHVAPLGDGQEGAADGGECTASEPAGGEQCSGEASATTAPAGVLGPQRQQIELLMSPAAQMWLFKRVADGSADPSAAFSGILQQIQEHFLTQIQALHAQP